MKQSQKLMMALELLSDISENWNEDTVMNYPQNLPSFDELSEARKYIESGELRNCLTLHSSLSDNVITQIVDRCLRGY